jgi:hypothetical protein
VGTGGEEDIPGEIPESVYVDVDDALLEGFTGTYYWVGELKSWTRCLDPIEKFNSDMFWPRRPLDSLAGWLPTGTYPIYIKGAHNRGEPDSSWLGIASTHDLKYLIRTPHAKYGVGIHECGNLQYDENGEPDNRMVKSGWILLDREAYVDARRTVTGRMLSAEDWIDPRSPDMFDLSQGVYWRHREKFKTVGGILSNDETPPLGMHNWWRISDRPRRSPSAHRIRINISRVNPKNYEGEQAQLRDLEHPKPNKIMMKRKASLEQQNSKNAYKLMTMDEAESASKKAAELEEQRKLRETYGYRIKNCLRTSLGACEPVAPAVPEDDGFFKTKYKEKRKKAIDSRNKLHETFPTKDMQQTVAEQRLALATALGPLGDDSLFEGLDTEMIKKIGAHGPKAPRTAVHREEAAGEGWQWVGPVDVARKTITESRERLERGFEPEPEPEQIWVPSGREQSTRTHGASMAAPQIGRRSRSPNRQRGDMRTSGGHSPSEDEDWELQQLLVET